MAIYDVQKLAEVLDWITNSTIPSWSYAELIFDNKIYGH